MDNIIGNQVPGRRMQITKECNKVESQLKNVRDEGYTERKKESSNLFEK
jgi:hypothetical protein